MEASHRLCEWPCDRNLLSVYSYACLAIVDNMANGVVATDELSLSSFKAQQKENQAKIIKATRLVLRQAAAKLAKVLASRSTANAGAGAGAGVGAGAGADSRVAVDSIVSARWVVRVEPEGVLENHAVVVKDGAIVEVMPTDEAMKKYRSASTVRFGLPLMLPVGLPVPFGWLPRHFLFSHRLFVCPSDEPAHACADARPCQRSRPLSHGVSARTC